jgi:transcriptional regulator of arginine metabolism
MNKSYRQGQITKLVHTRPVHTQQDLARQLKAAGIEATQVTLSRDIRELGLVKTAEGYRQLASAPASAGPPLASILGEFLVDVRQAEQILVLRTPPGGAQSVARALDQEAWPEVAGTIAGDDTVMVVAPNKKAAGTVKRRLLQLVK